ncbi:hypothetical protein [Nocardia sp. NPDC004722]
MRHYPRVGALNAAHRLADKPLPGAAEAVRRALNPGRAQRLHAMAVHADHLITALPVTGWPDALTGRRDAVILQLSTGGLSWQQIAALTQAEVTVTTQGVRIGSQPLLELPTTGGPACPVRVFSRWARVVAHAPAATGHIALERVLTATETQPADETEVFVPQPFPAEYAGLPLLCEFDARGLAHGHIDGLDPLHPEVVAEIALTHLLDPPRPAQAPRWAVTGTSPASPPAGGTKPSATNSTTCSTAWTPSPPASAPTMRRPGFEGPPHTKRPRGR